MALTVGSGALSRVTPPRLVLAVFLAIVAAILLFPVAMGRMTGTRAFFGLKVEATTGIEPVYAVLQTAP